MLSMALLFFTLEVAAALIMLGVVIRAVVQLLSDRTDVPFLRTPRAHYEMIAQALDIGPFDTVYELGSGDGGFIVWCARRYPKAKFIGIEKNVLLHHFASWRGALSGQRNLAFMHADIFDANLSGARKIYAYLRTPVMARLMPKLEREFHGRFASRAFTFKDKKASTSMRLNQKNGWHGEHVLYLYTF